MTKSELIEKIAAQNPNLTIKDIENLVEVILESVIKAMANGERVEFRGFGAFSVHHRGARNAKNPRTGASLKIGERNIPHFKAGKHLYEMLNK